MKITFVTPVANARESYRMDKVYDLDDDKARQYVSCGLALPAIERAIVPPVNVERATVKTRKVK